MLRTTISLLIGASLVTFAPQVVHARGCGGARAGGYSGGTAYHGSGGGTAYHGAGGGTAYHGAGGGSAYHGPEGGTAYRSPEGGSAYRGQGGGTAYRGQEGGTAYRGPEGGTAYRGQEGGTAYRGPEGGTAYRGQEGGTAYRGAEGGTAYRGPGGGTAYQGPGGATSYRSPTGTTYGAGVGAAGYNAAHASLPTDAGLGAGLAGGSIAGAGYGALANATAAMPAGIAAAQGAAVRNSFGNYGMYGQGWYAANRSAWAPAGWAAGAAWNAAAWPSVGAWYGWGGNVQPIPYNYGTNVTYQGDQVYVDSQPVASTGEYYQQVSNLAQTAPPPDNSSADWMPLGVFALVKAQQEDPHYILQLAVNKSGAVAGNYSDLIGGTTLPIQGAVDQKSQRLAWIVGNNKNTVGEAGLYNLTQDEAPALLHIGKDKTQQWLLVRLKQRPQDQTQPQP
jgi:hypothetical protein